MSVQDVGTQKEVLRFQIRVDDVTLCMQIIQTSKDLLRDDFDHLDGNPLIVIPARGGA